MVLHTNEGFLTQTKEGAVIPQAHFEFALQLLAYNPMLRESELEHLYEVLDLEWISFINSAEYQQNEAYLQCCHDYIQHRANGIYTAE